MRLIWLVFFVAICLLSLKAFLTHFKSATCSSDGTPSCKWMQPLSGRQVRHDPDAKQVVFFTDGTNFDDVVTLYYLIKSPRVCLVAIYIQGNGWANNGPSIRNMYNIMHMMGDYLGRVPIVMGSYHALIDEMRAAETGGLPEYSYRKAVPAGPTGILGSDLMLGLANALPQSPKFFNPFKIADTDDEAIPALFDVMEAYPAGTKFLFLSTGTLTPLAKMFSEMHVKRSVRLLKRVESLHVMGGAVFVPGNLFSVPTNERAEFNIYLDPHAAQMALQSVTRLKVPVVFVTLDATNSVPIQLRLLDALYNDSRTPEAQFVGQLMDRLRETWWDVDLFFSTAFLWDVSTAIAMLHSEVIQRARPVHIRVVTEEPPEGPNQGWTKPCSSKEIIKGICSQVTLVEGLFSDMVTNRLLRSLQHPFNSAQRSPLCL